jgi:hypothetical protein
MNREQWRIPSAEIRNTGLAAAGLGLQIISRGVEGRETLPVYVSCQIAEG